MAEICTYNNFDTFINVDCYLCYIFSMIIMVVLTLITFWFRKSLIVIINVVSVNI